MKRCVIFGAAGFIFSHFYDRLKQQPDIQVFGLDAFHYAANIEYSTEMSCIDCASFDQLDYWFREYEQFNLHPIDIAIVAQSSTHVDNSKYDPFSFARNNVLGTVNVLEACRRYGVEKVFVISTDETLRHEIPVPRSDCGRGAHGPFGYEKHKTEDTFFYRFPEADFGDSCFAPSSAYSASKLCQEVFVEAFKKTHGMNITVIRPTNIYGPRQHPEKLVAKTITSALKNEPITLYGQGLQWRDYNYVSDFCEALDLIIHQENPLPLYHIAANDERQNIETVKTILRLMNKSESLIEYVEDPRGSAHDPCYSLDCSNVKKLGWAPKTSFEDGILKTVDFYAKKLAL